MGVKERDGKAEKKAMFGEGNGVERMKGERSRWKEVGLRVLGACMLCCGGCCEGSWLGNVGEIQ